MVYSLTDAEKAEILMKRAETAEEVPIPGDAPLRSDRGVHGEMGMMIGTGGARGVYGALGTPLGDNGSASIYFQNSTLGRWGPR